MDDYSLESLEIRIPNLKSINIVNRLRKCETFGVRCNVHPFYLSRKLYQNIIPNLTITNVQKPSGCFLRKFTPDGRHLVAFSKDQTSVEIYQYNGAGAANDLLQDILPDIECTTHRDTRNLTEIRDRIFDTIFSLKHTVSVVNNPGNEKLNREFSLFISCSQFKCSSPAKDSFEVRRPIIDKSRKLIYEHNYVIVASAQYISEENFPQYSEIYQNNESHSLSARSVLEDYTLYLVDIDQGRLTDKRDFKVDKIFLSHNQGVYLYGKVLAVLSVQHQQIHIFHIDFSAKSGAKFVQKKLIGRFCNDDDESLINSAYNRFCNQRRTPAFREKSINLLKHRILVFLYRRAMEKKKSDNTSRALIEFNEQFNRLMNFRMWKIQMLDEELILIKYTYEEVITLRISEINSFPTMFVIYNLNTTQVLDVFLSNDNRLLFGFEKYCDEFRNSNSTHRVYSNFSNKRYQVDETVLTKSTTEQMPLDAEKSPCVVKDYTPFFMDHSFQFVSSPSNNQYSAAVQRSFKRTLKDPHRGEQEAAKRFLAQIPVSAQSFNCSPYLDFTLFSYDDKQISPLERPRQCDDLPIRFYDRTSGRLSFRIYPGIQNQLVPCYSARLLAAFTFHPYDPFIISIQRYNHEYIVNFHLRHCNLNQSANPFTKRINDFLSPVK